MKKYYQPLDLTLKDQTFHGNQIQPMDSKQVKQQLDDGTNLEEVDVKFLLTTLKSIHTACIIEF